MNNYPPDLSSDDFKHIHGDHLADDEQVSDCCGAEIENDICKDCMCHCEPYEIDPTEAYYARKGER